MRRLNISSGSEWENLVGYSRAVRVGAVVEVAGTVAVDQDGNVAGADDPYLQTKFIIAKIERALREAGAELKDVVRTRIYVTNMDHWSEIARAHGEAFQDIKPASTMIEVKALIAPEYLLEIEMTAIVENTTSIDY
jgi:enamine deaminase RidA (YjgF/YER057c/UK114 family)